jgi:hypothetical protein
MIQKALANKSSSPVEDSRISSRAFKFYHDPSFNKRMYANEILSFCIKIFQNPKLSSCRRQQLPEPPPSAIHICAVQQQWQSARIPRSICQWVRLFAYIQHKEHTNVKFLCLAPTTLSESTAPSTWYSARPRRLPWSARSSRSSTTRALRRVRDLSVSSSVRVFLVLCWAMGSAKVGFLACRFIVRRSPLDSTISRLVGTKAAVRVLPTGVSNVRLMLAFT